MCDHRERKFNDIINHYYVRYILILYVNFIIHLSSKNNNIKSKMNNIYLFGILSALSTVEGYQRTGSFSYQPYEAKPSMRFSYDFYGEGLAYDAKRDRLLLGTLSSGGPSVQGRIYSVPYFNSKIYNDETIITYDESDMFLVFQGNLR